jgi:hypothetical protein
MCAWNGFQNSHTLTQDQVVAGLIGNGVAPAQAPAIAKSAMDIIQAEPTKVLLVAVSAGGGAWLLLAVAAYPIARSLVIMVWAVLRNRGRGARPDLHCRQGLPKGRGFIGRRYTGSTAFVVGRAGRTMNRTNLFSASRLAGLRT